MDHEQLTEATLYMEEIEAHDTPVTRAQASFLRGCRKRLVAGRLNVEDVRRLEEIIDDLDYRAEYGDGADDDYDDEEFRDEGIDPWDAASDSRHTW